MDFLSAIKCMKSSENLSIRRKIWGPQTKSIWFDCYIGQWVEGYYVPNMFRSGSISPEDFLATDWEVELRK